MQHYLKSLRLPVYHSDLYTSNPKQCGKKAIALPATMIHNAHPALLLLCAIGLTIGCQQPRENDLLKKLDEKARPYDLFSFQRSYPDRSFDWQGWRDAMAALSEEETAVAARLQTACDGSTTPWTLQGPGNVGGRCNTIAVKPDNEDVLLAGFAAGGIFKSTDGAVTWRPVFDNNLQLAVGDITFDPTDPNVVYAGTGDPNIPSIVFNGDGLYKSTDAGETWQYIGLREVGIISKVVVDPANNQNIYVAAMGDPHVRTPNRGIYKSFDGGQTWQQSLFVSDQAGASDLVLSTGNPSVLYASFWDRIRNNYESIVYGPNSKVFKSVDGGFNWMPVEGGLPTGIMGRTGLAISRQNPQKLYVVYVDSLSRPGGIYKTINGGLSWTPMLTGSLASTYANFGWYFGKLTLNPNNDEDVYFHAILLWNKAPNTTAWVAAAGGHADSHDLVFTPSGRRYWANDGGVYRNNPGQLGFVRSKNLPTTQFYHTNFNPHFPQEYFAGAQDNGVQKGNASVFNNWVSLIGADGFRCLFHPTDPNTYWLETQDGMLNKTMDNGQNWEFTPTCLGTGDRCNWDMPLFQSVHNPLKFYAATHRVYFNVDGGGWGGISGDLTDGNILGERFHNISCLNESPILEGKLIAGTSDGNVWRLNASGTWTNLTNGLPNRYVTSVHGSPTAVNRFFVTHSGFRDSENIPHIHRSDNDGQTWVNISGDLPQIPVNDLWIMPNHADSVLFAATDGGVYFTTNSGVHWARLGSGIPYVPVFDLEHNPVRRELAAATFARGIFTFPLDSVLKQKRPVFVNVGGAVSTESGAKVPKVTFTGRPGVETNTLGTYTLPTLPGCQSHTIIPYRNDNPLNGVTTLDLALMSKHILGIERFTSPFPIIAADANKSGSVTTFDVVTLRRLILGIDTAFANNTSWRFVPSNYTFPNPADPFQASFPESLNLNVQNVAITNAHFTGIKVGDVNGSVDPTARLAAEARGSEPSVPLVLEDRAFQAGDAIEIVLQAPTASLEGLQFTLKFNAEALAFQAIDPEKGLIGAEYMGANRAAAGVLTFCFEPVASLAARGRTAEQLSKPLLALRFTARQSGVLSQVLRIANQPTPALAFRETGGASQPVLQFQSPNPTVRCFPNPFGTAGVSFETNTGSTGMVRLEIFDLHGKRIVDKKYNNAAPTNTVHLPATLFPQAGVYLYTVDMGTHRISGKMICQ